LTVPFGHNLADMLSRKLRFAEAEQGVSSGACEASQ
jgi:hypothetical protein